MANEIALSITLTYTNAAENIAANSLGGTDTISINVAPGVYVRNIQQATTTKANLNLPLLSAAGYTVLHNCDSTNAIKVYHASGAATAAILLNPGEWAVFRWGVGTVPQIQSAAGTPMLEYYVINN